MGFFKVANRINKFKTSLKLVEPTKIQRFQSSNLTSSLVTTHILFCQRVLTVYINPISFSNKNKKTKMYNKSTT